MNERTEDRATHVVVVANQKGGVGKTTNTINIAAAMGELGHRSLIIDLDMTAGATKALNVPTSGWVSTFELVTRAEEAEHCIIDETEEEVVLPRGVHLVPASRRLNELDAWLAHPENRWVNPLDLLLEPMEQLRGLYDFVFLDTPPQITKTTLPAFRAADYVILSATPERLAVDGLADALMDIANAKRAGNDGIRLLGVAVCAFVKGKRMTRLARELIKYIDDNITDEQGVPLRFENEISRAVAVQEAQRAGQSIFEYDPSHAIAEQYRALARELLARIASHNNVELAPQPRPLEVEPSEETSGSDDALLVEEAGNA